MPSSGLELVSVSSAYHCYKKLDHFMQDQWLFTGGQVRSLAKHTALGGGARCIPGVVGGQTGLDSWPTGTLV